ncbi:hypothetical protein RvY_06676 [Ramazzottius varieornatus]|uniref:Uncharacterized protein n=1 Tax=Ramazzottius varieornatus TaxID=947166 RepID=A0A1D1V4V0_RAMVA|nr:hypothetical protein RvY_06676 [Ramazzottius varieornatus]
MARLEQSVNPIGASNQLNRIGWGRGSKRTFDERPSQTTVFAVLAHQTIWNIQCSKYTDEEGKNENPVLFRKLQEIREEVIRRLESGSAKASREREFALIKEITDISGTIKPYEKGEKRK